ncbi:hypothetical protein FA849_19310 [Escherichia coli]|nr:hypothetical protein [Escherichia coli]
MREDDAVCRLAMLNMFKKSRFFDISLKHVDGINVFQRHVKKSHFINIFLTVPCPPAPPQSPVLPVPPPCHP